RNKVRASPGPIGEGYAHSRQALLLAGEVIAGIAPAFGQAFPQSPEPIAQRMLLGIKMRFVDRRDITAADGKLVGTHGAQLLAEARHGLQAREASAGRIEGVVKD